MEPKTQVDVIGVGITGVDIARDLAQRGIDFVLLAKGDVTDGSSGSNTISRWRLERIWP